MSIDVILYLILSLLHCSLSLQGNVFKEKKIVIPDDTVWWENIIKTSKTTEPGVMGLMKCSSLCNNQDCNFFTFDKDDGSCILLDQFESI